MLFTIYMWAVLLPLTIGLGSLIIFTLPVDRRYRVYNFIIVSWARLVIRLSGCPVTVSGLGNVDPSRPAVYMTNHQSYFDVICLIGRVPVPVRFVAKQMLIYVPVVGQIIWGAGHIFIRRDDPRQAFQSLDRAADKIRQGVSVLVFPEGTRSPDHRLGPFKKGGFVLAIKAGVPIIPISLAGTRPMMPKGSYRFSPTRVHLVVGEPISTAGCALSDKDALIARVRRAILDGFPAGSAEALANRGELESPPPQAA